MDKTEDGAPLTIVQAKAVAAKAVIAGARRARARGDREAFERLYEEADALIAAMADH